MNPSWVHTAGDTLSFQVNVTGFLSTDGWTLTYYLTPRFTDPVQAQIVVVASGNADGSYQVQEAAANTANWKPGAYGWQRRVSKAGVFQTLSGSEDQGECLVRPNPTDIAQGYDGRSHERKMLDAIEACLENRASTTQREMVAYSIGSRSMEFDKDDSRSKLVELRSKYEWLVANADARERAASGLSNPRQIGVRFVR